MSSYWVLSFILAICLSLWSETMATWMKFTTKARVHNFAQGVGVTIVHLTIATLIAFGVFAQVLVGFLISMFVWGKTNEGECFAFNKWKLTIRHCRDFGRWKEYKYRSIFSTKPGV